MTPHFNNPGPKISVPQRGNALNLSPLPLGVDRPDALGSGKGQVLAPNRHAAEHVDEFRRRDDAGNVSGAA